MPAKAAGVLLTSSLGYPPETVKKRCQTGSWRARELEPVAALESSATVI